MATFQEMDLGDRVGPAIKQLGFDTPTQIQEESIPLILEGKDVMGESATGSGKTLAFGCAVVEFVEPKAGFQALILTPTRELAEQVRGNLSDLAPHLQVAVVYGGVALEPQAKALKTAEVVVATPGRFMDLMERNAADLSKIHLLILDEADRMLDMGFIDDVEKIVADCPLDRQTLFFSATLSQEIRTLSERFMYEPEFVSAAKQVDPKKLKQVYYEVPNAMKLSLLVHLLQQEDSGLVMVFCNTRRAVDVVVKNLKAQKLNAIAIHGGLSQNKRSHTLNLFHKGRVSVLVCTDVAARGLHIDNVSHVYNYDLPNDSRDYIHRIGRTARAGKDGIVVNLLSDRDHENFSRIMWDYKPDMEKLDKGFIKKIPMIGGFSGRGGPQRGGQPGFNRRGPPRRR